MSRRVYAVGIRTSGDKRPRARGWRRLGVPVFEGDLGRIRTLYLVHELGE